jgi:hypothetical protein
MRIDHGEQAIVEPQLGPDGTVHGDLHRLRHEGVL